MKWLANVLCLCLVMGAGAAATAADSQELSSPGGVLRVLVARDGDGRLQYSVTRRHGTGEWVPIVAA